MELILFNVYGHTSKGKGVIKQVYAQNAAEALEEARKLYPDCKFNHVNIN